MGNWQSVAVELASLENACFAQNKPNDHGQCCKQGKVRIASPI
jgi:hypothetical protein